MSRALRSPHVSASRPLTRRPPPILLAVLLAPLSLGLGYAGYRQAALGPERSDALYASLQLFTGGGAIPEQTPWQLDVARFLAPLAVVYAAVIAALSLLRDRAQRAIVRLIVRDHVLVIGLGEAAALVTRGLRRDGHRVVVLELNPLNPRIAAARSEGVRVLIGDGTSAPHLRRAQASRARHVLVLTSDDGRNLEIAGAARQGLGAQPATLHVALSDVALWKELDRLRLGESQDAIATEYVNLDDRTAQRLLAAAAAVTGQDAPARTSVDGNSGVAVRVVAHVVRRGLLSGIRPHIELVGPAAPELLDRLRTEEPWCEEHADLVLAGEPTPLVIVCRTDSDSAAMARGLVLARERPGAAVVVAVYRPRNEDALQAAGPIAARVHLIPAAVDDVGVELLARSSVEVMARVRHEDYVARERAKPGAQANTSLVGWDDLPESLRESNRAFARAVSSTLAQLGATLTPLAGPVHEGPLAVPLDVLDRLARGEHDRWMAALVGDGWQPTDGPKDPVAKRHPLLVPWEALDEAEREKDRDAFRALPHMLARIGYALELDVAQRKTA